MTAPRTVLLDKAVDLCPETLRRMILFFIAADFLVRTRVCNFARTGLVFFPVRYLMTLLPVAR
jgi:hypothetical protein